MRQGLQGERSRRRSLGDGPGRLGTPQNASEPPKNSTDSAPRTRQRVARDPGARRPRLGRAAAPARAHGRELADRAREERVGRVVDAERQQQRLDGRVVAEGHGVLLEHLHGLGAELAPQAPDHGALVDLARPAPGDPEPRDVDARQRRDARARRAPEDAREEPLGLGRRREHELVERPGQRVPSREERGVGLVAHARDAPQRVGLAERGREVAAPPAAGEQQGERLPRREQVRDVPRHVGGEPVHGVRSARGEGSARADLLLAVAVGPVGTAPIKGCSGASPGGGAEARRRQGAAPG